LIGRQNGYPAYQNHAALVASGSGPTSSKEGHLNKAEHV